MEPVDDVKAAATDKDLTQRLESTVIHWTHQIKEVVNTQQDNTTAAAETSGPLGEIEFWRRRTVDLSGIGEQLQREGVRRIVAVLEASKSSYLGPFNHLSNMIQRGSEEANDNLKFLTTLMEPCLQLHNAEPKVCRCLFLSLSLQWSLCSANGFSQLVSFFFFLSSFCFFQEIPAVLPDILNRVRVIGTVSRHYRSSERLTGLLRKISNEIINRCCAKISVDDVFDGDVLAVMDTLNESIDCGLQWKVIYQRVCRVKGDVVVCVCACVGSPSLTPSPPLLFVFQKVAEMTRNPAPGAIRRRPWDFDEAAIFAQIEAFVERCRNLLEVCEGQVQFARKSVPGNGGAKANLPAFGGSRGPEIAKSLLGIEETFELHMERLRPLKDEILDVQVTRWHDANNAFKNGMRDLEVMMQNVINAAFDGVKSITVAAELLEAFSHLAKRPNIQRAVDKRAAAVYAMFKAAMDSTKAYFEAHRLDPPLGLDEPKYAGSALWAKGLQADVERDWQQLEACHFITPCKEQAAALETYEDLMSVFEEHIRKKYSEWMTELSGTDQGALQVCGCRRLPLAGVVLFGVFVSVKSSLLPALSPHDRACGCLSTRAPGPPQHAAAHQSVCRHAVPAVGRHHAAAGPQRPARLP